MSLVNKIKDEIESLSHKEYMKLVHWFTEREWETWDKELEADSQSGKLDFLFEEALYAKGNGTLRDL